MAIERANDQAQRTQTILKCLKLELRLLQKNQLQYVHFEGITKQYEKETLTLIQTLNQIKDDVQRDELLASVRGCSTTGFKQDQPEKEEDSDNVLRNASTLQNKTQESIDRTTKHISEAKDLGIIALKNQKEQSEQILSIHKDTNDLDERLNYSDRLIRTLRVRLRFDRTFQCFICFNILLLLSVFSVGTYMILRG